MAITLRPWQEPSCRRLVEIFGAGGKIAADCSSTGTGKSYIAIETCRRLQRQPLIVAPKSVLTAWRRIAEDAGVTPLDVFNPEKLIVGRGVPWYKASTWRGIDPDRHLLIYDEVHRGASGVDSKQGYALARTKVFNIPVLALSATIADSPTRMRALGFLFGFHRYNETSFDQWCRQEFGCRYSPVHRGLVLPYGKAKAKEAMLKLRAMMQDRMVRINSDDLDDFPESKLEVCLYDLSTRDQKEIDEIYNRLSDGLKHGHENEQVDLLFARQRLELFKVPIALELAQAALEEGKAPVVFFNFRESAIRFRDAIGNCSLIIGGQTETERQLEMDRFQANETQACACTSAGGLGVGLHDTRHERPRVSYIMPCWKAEDFKQILGRIHRSGGTNVLQTVMCAAKTVEERVYRTLQRKLNNIDTLNDGDLEGET